MIAEEQNVKEGTSNCCVLPRMKIAFCVVEKSALWASFEQAEFQTFCTISIEFTTFKRKKIIFIARRCGFFICKLDILTIVQFPILLHFLMHAGGMASQSKIVKFFATIVLYPLITSPTPCLI